MKRKERTHYWAIEKKNGRLLRHSIDHTPQTMDTQRIAEIYCDKGERIEKVTVVRGWV